MRKLGVGIPGGMLPGLGMPPKSMGLKVMGIPPKSMGPKVMGMPGITPGMLKLNKRRSAASPQKSPSEQSSKSPLFPSKSPLRSPNLCPEDVSFNLLLLVYQNICIISRTQRQISSI